MYIYILLYYVTANIDILETLYNKPSKTHSGRPFKGSMYWRKVITVTYLHNRNSKKRLESISNPQRLKMIQDIDVKSVKYAN